MGLIVHTLFFIHFINQKKILITHSTLIKIMEKIINFINALEEIGIIQKDIIILKKLCFEYNSKNIFEFLQIHIPMVSASFITTSTTWPLYHYDGLNLNTILLLRVLVGITNYMRVCPNHQQAMTSLIHHHGNTYFNFYCNFNFFVI